MFNNPDNNNNPTLLTKKPQFAANPDVQILVDYVLKTHAEGIRDLKYPDLNALVRRDLQHPTHRHVMTTARRRLQADHGLVLAAVTGKGFRILTDEEKARTWRPTVTRVGRALQLAGRKLATIANIHALSDAARTEALTGQAVVGTLASLTSAKAVARVASTTGKMEERKVLSVAETVERLKGGRD